MVTRTWLAGIAADADTMTEARIYANTPEWHALLEWCEFHGIDPLSIPVGTRISRDECGRCIRYLRIVEDEQGRKQFHPPGHPRSGELVTEPAVEQGEAPPLPYPDVVAFLLRPRPRTTPGHDHDCSVHTCWRPNCCHPRRPDCTPETP